MGCCCSSSEDDSLPESEMVENTILVVKAGPRGKQVLCKQLCEGQYELSCKSASGASGDKEARGGGLILSACALEADIAYWEVHTSGECEGVSVGIVRFNPKAKNAAQILESVIDTTSTSPSAATTNRDKGTPEFYGMSLTNEDSNKVIGVHWDQSDLPMLQFTRYFSYLFLSYSL